MPIKEISVSKIEQINKGFETLSLSSRALLNYKDKCLKLMREEFLALGNPEICSACEHAEKTVCDCQWYYSGRYGSHVKSYHLGMC